MPAFKAKTEYAMNFDADKRILRSEFMNAVQPALNKALEELALKHTALEARNGAPERFCSAFEEVQSLAEIGMQRALGIGTG